MYYALDAAYDNSYNKTLGKYLSDANPFRFKDGGSADPAIYSEFRSLIESEDGSTHDASFAYAFVRRYLTGKGSELISAFDSVADENSWDEAVLDVQ